MGRASRHAAQVCLWAVAVAVVGVAATAPRATHPVAPRTLYFDNLCPYEVRLGATGGNTGLACAVTADCPGGTWCGGGGGTGGGGHCYFSLATPEGGFDMGPGDTRQVTLNAPIVTQSGQSQVWSGAVFGSTGCATTPGCATAICSHNGTCPPQRGAAGATVTGGVHAAAPRQ